MTQHQDDNWVFGTLMHRVLYHGVKESELLILVDDCGQILSFRITCGNVDDRKPVPNMLKNFIGKVFGDKGYISKKWAEFSL
jgi:hypothetical protein